jgi:hypothetical protein
MRVIPLLFVFGMGMGTGGAVEAGAHWAWLLYAAAGSLAALLLALWCTRDRNLLAEFTSYPATQSKP